MTNRRKLKKGINAICEELLVDAVAASLYGKESNTGADNLEALLFSIVKTQNHYVKRVSHAEPGMRPKLYFKDVKEKFAAQLSDIADQIQEM